MKRIKKETTIQDTRLDILKSALDNAVEKKSKSPRTRDEYLAVAEKLLTGKISTESITSRSRWLQISATISYMKLCNAIEEDESFGLNLKLLRSDFKHAASEDDVIDRIEEKCLTNQQYESLLLAFPKTQKGLEIVRACKISRRSGARLSEVLALKRRDIQIDDDGIHVKIRNGKGRKKRTVYLPPNCKEIFECFTGFTITREYVNMTFYNTAKKLGFLSSFHGLRHSFATEMAQAGLTPYQLAAILGHSDIKTTMIYTHIKKEIPSAMKEFWKKTGQL